MGAVLANPLVEPREADRHRPDPLQVTSQLLGAPGALEPVRDEVPDRWMELARAGDGPLAALSSELLGLVMVIAGAAGVPLESATDGGLVTLELSGDGGDRESLLVQGLDLAALVVIAGGGASEA